MSSTEDVPGCSTSDAGIPRYEKPDSQQDEVAVYDEIDADEERRLVKKLDRFIMPLMAIVYFFQYLDKGSISYAAVFGLRKDLGLSGEDFSCVVSLFFFGQLVSEPPAAYILSRFHVTLFVGITIIVWGLMEICIGLSKNFLHLAVTHFFLGFTEAAVSPAFVVITSNWYRRHEHPMRVATWISMNGVSQIAGSLLMYAIGGAHLGISSWRAIFVLCGVLTVICGIAFVLLMPVHTMTAWFLTEREREIATARLAVDRATRDKANFDTRQTIEALKSPLTWSCGTMALLIGLTTPMQKYSSIVITGFGFSKFPAMLVSLPAGALNFITVWISALIPHYFPGTRILTVYIFILLPLIGSTLFMSLPAVVNGDPSWGIVVSTWLAGCNSAPFCSCAALLASNVKGNTKKSITSAMFFVAFCVGSIAGPQVWLEKEAPRYRMGSLLSILCWVALMLVLRFYQTTARKENNIRDRKAAEGRAEYSTTWVDKRSHAQIGVSENSDLTDIEDKGFRYST
ncbi:pantothenate transporter [Fusarium heterosporum]|uniref:Pantothenate transporter n=1 Tax=Fusarium heterosporum TaxID=42747 RepID=A0A8H5WLG5_FUSHE|nr:pantothenate transporter [Fusarium heterosporum]